MMQEADMQIYSETKVYNNSNGRLCDSPSKKNPVGIRAPNQSVNTDLRSKHQNK